MEVRNQDTRVDPESLTAQVTSSNEVAVPAPSTVFSKTLENIQKTQEGILRILDRLVPSSSQDTSTDGAGRLDERGTPGFPTIHHTNTSEQRPQHLLDPTRMARTSEITKKSGEDVRTPMDYVTKEELIGLLKAERSKVPSVVTAIDFHPPYPTEIASKPYPHGYVSPVFRKYNGKFGNAKEYIIQFIDDLGIYAHDHELRLREFSKSLTERAYSWYASLQPGGILNWEDLTSQFCAKFFMIEDKWSIADLTGERQRFGESLVDYVQKFREKALDCAETMPKKDLVKMCIKGMLDEYRIHIENHSVYSFAELVAKARNTGATVARLFRMSKQDNTPQKSWRGPKRGIEIAVAQGKKSFPAPKRGKRDDKPPEFPCSKEKVYTLLEAWIRDGEVILPFIEKLPSTQEQQHELYCHFHRRINHPTMNCYTLRRIFHDRLQKGEIIIDENTVEQVPFPQHQNNGVVMTCSGGLLENRKTVHIEEVYEELADTNNEPQDTFVTSLLRTKLFRNFPTLWHEFVPLALWAYRTSKRGSTGFTSFSLLYGSEAVLPAEVAVPSARLAMAAGLDTQQSRLQELELLDERRNLAQGNLIQYQRRVARAYDKLVRPRMFSKPVTKL